MRGLGLLVLLIFSCFDCPAQDMFGMTSKALMSYERVENRADYLVMKIKNATFGDDTEKVLMFAPIITGKLEFFIEDFKVYLDTRDEESGIKYTYNF